MNAGLATARSVTAAALPEPCASCEARPISVCSALEDNDLHRLAAVAVAQHVEPGRAFIGEGDPAEHFYNVTGGTARLSKSLPDGRRQITGFATAGHFLGLAVSDVYCFGAEAIDPVRVCRFSRTRLRAVLADFPEMERRLLRTAANELVAAQDQMLLLGRKTARERIATFLLAQSAPSQPCTPPRAGFHLPMNRTDIADYLGLTIETVSRTMTWMRGQRLIALPAAADVVILDRARLREIATGMASPD